VVRPARDGDWPAIWPFLRDIVRAGETYTWETEVTEDRAREKWMQPPPWQVVVAESPDGKVIGTAKYGPNQEGPGNHVANASFMVDRRNAVGGVGRALAEHVIDAARQTGYLAMQFNAVVATNTRAVSLWQSLGFEILTTIPDAFRHPTDGYVGLHVMYRRL
jgi:L-amino acid N-acyltransferase YncA